MFFPNGKRMIEYFIIQAGDLLDSVIINNEIAISPPTIKYDTFIFNPDLLKDHYIKIGFKEVWIGKYPEHVFLYNDLKCIRCHYGFFHYVTGTIHVAMGDTYNHMEILVSDTDFFNYGIAVSWLLFYRELG